MVQWRSPDFARGGGNITEIFRNKRGTELWGADGINGHPRESKDMESFGKSHYRSKSSLHGEY